MCKVMEDMRNESAKTAVEKRNIEIALDMIRDGKLSLEQIAQYSRLAIDRVRELAAPKAVRQNNNNSQGNTVWQYNKRECLRQPWIIGILKG